MFQIKIFLFSVFIFICINGEKAECETDTVNFPVEEENNPGLLGVVGVIESELDGDSLETTEHIEHPSEKSNSTNDSEPNDTDDEICSSESESDCSDVSLNFRRCVLPRNEPVFSKVEHRAAVAVAMPVDPPVYNISYFDNVIDFHIKGKLEDWLVKLQAASKKVHGKTPTKT